MISCALHINIINEATNWLFLVLFPVLFIAVLRKESVIGILGETGLKRFDPGNAIRTLLVCILYTGVILLVFSLSDQASDILTSIPKILAKLPVYFCIMLLTAAFTEEFFFRGILQRYLINALKRPYTAILFASILFGLYHFPFAFYLWDETSGNILHSLSAIMINQAVTGYAFGFIYYKSNKNLWSSIILHAFTNAAIMSLSVALSRS